MLKYTVALTISATFARTGQGHGGRMRGCAHHHRLPPGLFHPLMRRSVLLNSPRPCPRPGTHHCTSCPRGSARPGHRTHTQEGSCSVHPFASGWYPSVAFSYRSVCALGERTCAPRE